MTDVKYEKSEFEDAFLGMGALLASHGVKGPYAILVNQYYTDYWPNGKWGVIPVHGHKDVPKDYILLGPKDDIDAKLEELNESTDTT